MPEKQNVIIMGAAGRDFHNFNSYFRDNKRFKVVAFTATQIPFIGKRVYPPKLSGKLYPKGIPIHWEKNLPSLVKKLKADSAVFSYSDISNQELMEKAAWVNKTGANFVLLSTENTYLNSKKPVIAITAVRTGSGKSQTSRAIAKYYKSKGYRVGVVRHPMPYGELGKSIVQRFAKYSDLKKYKSTIEEREEYEPYIELGVPIYAGVDYEKILRKVEKESDVVIWDGGNNDPPFFKPDLHIVVADPHRAGHELLYYHGQVNFRLADAIIINKVATASKRGIETIKQNAKKYNPSAKVYLAESPLKVNKPAMIRGKKVLVVEDGPTLTHGGMKFGAGTIAAKKGGVKKIVNPRKYAKGTIKSVFKSYPDIGVLLPAMGYSKEQVNDLQRTINSVPCDVVVDGTPVNLHKLIRINKPIVEVSYSFKAKNTSLGKILENVKVKKS